MKQKKLYILKVALSYDKKIWRKIEILSHQSLDQLHEIIFAAFDRFDHHMYSFYITKPGSKSRNRFSHAPEYTHPYMLETKDGFGVKELYDAAKTKLADLRLKEKSKIEYLFDFGDEWLHEITVEKILDIFPDKDYPNITTRKGESPPQYSSDEDDWEDDYEDESTEAKFDKIIDANDKLLIEFHNYLISKKLSEETIERHLAKVEFYINEYLLDEKPLLPQDGVDHVNYFLGSWFMHRTTWASITSIKSNIASLKHFYTFMAETGQVTIDKLARMKQEIKENKDVWIESLKN